MAKRSIDIVHPKLDPSSQTPPAADLADAASPDPAPVEETAAEQTPVPPVKRPPKVNKPPSIQPENPTAPPVPRGTLWPAYLAGLVVIAIVVFFGVRAASSLVNVWTDLSPTNLTARESDGSPAAPEAAAETTETAAVTDTAATDTAATEESATTPAAEPAVDKTSLKIKILNGSGVSGAAAAGQKVLEDAGFKVEATGNARKFNYDTTIAYYPAGKSAAAAAVVTALTGSYSVTSEENSVADGYDVLVVIGQK